MTAKWARPAKGGRQQATAGCVALALAIAAAPAAAQTVYSGGGSYSGSSIVVNQSVLDSLGPDPNAPAGAGVFGTSPDTPYAAPPPSAAAGGTAAPWSLVIPPSPYAGQQLAFPPQEEPRSRLLVDPRAAAPASGPAPAAAMAPRPLSAAVEEARTAPPRAEPAPEPIREPIGEPVRERVEQPLREATEQPEPEPLPAQPAATRAPTPRAAPQAAASPQPVARPSTPAPAAAPAPPPAAAEPAPEEEMPPELAEAPEEEPPAAVAEAPVAPARPEPEPAREEPPAAAAPAAPQEAPQQARDEPTATPAVAPLPEPEPEAAAEPEPSAEPAAPPSQVAALATAAPPGDLSLEFASASSELDAAMRDRLLELARQLRADEALRIQLMAYAAGDGGDPSRARRLSLSRALAVRSFLLDQGVRSTRMDVRALGHNTPAGPPDRVDIVVAPS